MLFWPCVNGVHLSLFLHKWFKCCEYICFSTLGTCTPCYLFITLLFHVSGLDRFFQSRPCKNKYVHEAFHDSNTRQQCPELDTVDVEMCKEPHTNEDCRRRGPKTPRHCGPPTVVVLVTLLLVTPQDDSTSLRYLQASFHRLEQTNNSNR